MHSIATCPKRTAGGLYLFRRQPVTASTSSGRRSRELTHLASVAWYGLAGQSVPQGVILLALVMIDLAQAEALSYAHADALEGLYRPSCAHAFLMHCGSVR